MKIRSRLTCLSACFCAAPLAHALGLGGISGSGGPAQPLDAYVALYLAPAERASLEGVALLPELSLDAAADSALLARIAVRIEHQADGSFVHLTSAEPLPVERLKFRLRVNSGGGAVTGHYSLRMPALQAALAPVTGRSRDIVARPAAIGGGAAAPAALPAPGEGRYGPVRNGESLWLIAKRLTGGRGLERMMSALHALNPQAFVGGDMARLRVGVFLQLPAGSIGPSAAAERDAVTAPADTRREKEAAPPPRAEPKAALVRRKPSAVPPPASGGQTRERMLRDPELAARLAELDAKFAAIRARYAAPTALPTDASPAGEPATATTPVASAAERAPETDAAVVPAPVAAEVLPPVAEHAPPPAAEPSAPVATVAKSSARQTGNGWSLYLATGALLLGIGAWSARRALHLRTAREARDSFEDRAAADADRRAEVARKAESRVRLESQIKGMRDRRNAEGAPGSLATTVQDHGATPLPALGAATNSARGEDPRTEGMSPEVAIDTSIALGHYAEAEVMLREALAASPDSVQLKMRLAELYYITEQAERFAELAADLKSRDRGHLTDEEWKRVVRMGKILAPELMPFSGPKLVGSHA